MDQNKKKILTLSEARAAAQATARAGAQGTLYSKMAFQELLEEAPTLDPALGGFEELSTILALPEDSFALIAPVFLDELQRSVSNTEDKLILISAMNASGTKLEDLMEQYQQICNEIDNNFPMELSTAKKDFVKQMLAVTYNAIGEANGIPRRIVNIPIELTSENAKIPTYANLGDGAVDLYAPADYTINPGETVVIPCDIKVALPYGYAFLIHPRSGLSAKTKLRVANSIGLVDSQYKGVVGVIMENVDAPIKDVTYEFDENNRPVITSILHGQSYTISKGERFAQMRLVEVPTANFFQVESVAGMGDDRGGGFGSSGTN